jgi:hypothetical protein
MKTNKETKNAAKIVFGIGIICIAISLYGCGKTVVGPPGPQGPQGSSGSQGPAGQNGTSCTVVSNSGGATVECSDGSSSPIYNGATGVVGATGATGNQGATGSTGPQGPAGQNGQSCLAAVVSNGIEISCPGSVPVVVTNGSNGTNGTNATPVTVVQLCPGVTVYPSTFVEQALCINGNLYGVYSANDGFLSYLPPGTYSSDGINASCNLTIKPNCVVVDN